MNSKLDDKKGNNNVKHIYIAYYIILCIISSEENKGIFHDLVAGGFTFVWSIFVGAVISLVLFPFLSSFIKFSSSTKNFVIDNSHYFITAIGFSVVIYLLYLHN